MEPAMRLSSEGGGGMEVVVDSWTGGDGPRVSEN